MMGTPEKCTPEECQALPCQQQSQVAQYLCKAQARTWQMQVQGF